MQPWDRSPERCGVSLPVGCQDIGTAELLWCRGQSSSKWQLGLKSFGHLCCCDMLEGILKLPSVGESQCPGTLCPLDCFVLFLTVGNTHVSMKELRNSCSANGVKAEQDTFLCIIYLKIPFFKFYSYMQAHPPAVPSLPLQFDSSAESKESC